MADVLLVNAPVRGAETDVHASLGLPLGLAYIAAVLMQNGYRPAIADLNISGLNPARVRSIIEMADPALLGISTHTETYLAGLEVARIAKELRPDLPVVMGGPHSTVMYPETASMPYRTPETTPRRGDCSRIGTSATPRARGVAVFDLLECVSGAGRAAARPRSYCASVRKVRSP